jgi:hypothetical protein
MAPTQGPRLRLEFWQAFKQYMAQDCAVTCGRASSETWMHHDGGLKSGRLFSMIRVRTSEIGSQYALDDACARTVYSFLQAHRADVDAQFGQDVTWRIVSERMHEVEVRRPAALERREDWPDLFMWLSDNLHTFQASLGEFVGRWTPVCHRGEWDEGSFFEELAVYNGRAVQPARQILEWGKCVMPLTYWGHGQKEGSFVPVARRRGIDHSMVSVYTTGVFCLRFGALKKEPPFHSEELRLELLARLNEALHFDLPPIVVEQYPSLPLPLLQEPGVMDAFLDAMDWAVGVVTAR